MKNLTEPLSPFRTAEMTEVTEKRKVFSLSDCELNFFRTIRSGPELSFTSLYPAVSTMIFGEALISVNASEPFTYRPGEMLILPVRSKLNFHFPGASRLNPAEFTVLYVYQQKICEAIDYITERFPTTSKNSVWRLDFDQFLHFDSKHELIEVIDYLFKVIRSKNYQIRETIVNDLVKELVIRIMQLQDRESIAKQASFDPSPNRFSHLVKYIEENLTRSLKVEELCRIMYMSRPSFFRTFKSEFGISPVDYIIKERIRLAKTYLQCRSSIKEACFRSGFNNLHYFVRTFKRIEGVTPKTFRILADPLRNRQPADFQPGQRPP